MHRRIADIRADVLHKLTTSLTRYRTIVIEDLNVAGMLANRRLSRAITDVGFFEFRRQLEYKAAMAGTTLIVADRWLAPSKRCSVCQEKNETLTLAERTWTCALCGTSHDRDLNAACNRGSTRRVGPGQPVEPKALAAGIAPIVKPAA